TAREVSPPSGCRRRLSERNEIRRPLCTSGVSTPGAVTRTRVPGAGVVDVCAIAAPPGATCATAATQTTMLRTVMRISQSPQREIRTDRIRNCRALRPKTYGVLRIAQGRIEGRNCRASDCPAKHHAHLRIDAKTAHPFRMRRLLNSLPLDYSSSPSSLAIPGGLA